MTESSLDDHLNYCHLCGESEIDSDLHGCHTCNLWTCNQCGYEVEDDCGDWIGVVCDQCMRDSISFGKGGE